MVSGMGVKVASEPDSSGNVQVPDSALYIRTSVPINHPASQGMAIISSSAELGTFIESIPYDFSKIGGKRGYFFAMYDAKGNEIPDFAASAFLNAMFSPGFFSSKALMCVPYSCPSQDHMITATKLIRNTLPAPSPEEQKTEEPTNIVPNAAEAQNVNQNTNQAPRYTYTADFQSTNKVLTNNPSSQDFSKSTQNQNVPLENSQSQNTSDENNAVQSSNTTEYWVLIVPIQK